MKIFLSALVIVLLLAFARQITGANKNGKLLPAIPQVLKKQTIGVDTFYAVRTIFQQGRKAIAKDTIILIIHEIVVNPPKARAGIKYLLEPLPYNAFDTANPVKAAVDTIVWTHKPYKP
jgi:hypothetical protein